MKPFPLLLCVLTLVAQAELQIQLDPGVLIEEVDPAMPAPEAKGHGAAAQAEAEKELFDEVEFLSGEWLSGSLKSFTQGKISWEHPDGLGEFEWTLKNLQEIRLRESRLAKDAFSGLPRVQLVNGDVWHGELLRLADGTLSIRHPLAGVLNLKAGMVASIEVPSPTKAIYEGPNSIDEWKMAGQDSWKYGQGALYSVQQGHWIGRKLSDLPDKAHIHFKAQWRGQPQLGVVFWCDNLQNMHQDSFNLMVQGNYFRCYRYANHRGNGDLGATNVDQFMTKTEAVFDLYLDRKAKKMSLMVDGVMIKEWRDTTGADIEGKHLLFQNNGGGATVKLSQIRVSGWDGKLGEEEEEKGKEEDYLQFRNGDGFHGELLGIADGHVKVKSQFAEFSAPIEGMSFLRLAASSREALTDSSELPVIVWADGSRSRFALRAMKEGKIQGDHNALGDVAIPVEAVSALEFNLGDERRENAADFW